MKSAAWVLQDKVGGDNVVTIVTLELMNEWMQWNNVMNNGEWCMMK